MFVPFDSDGNLIRDVHLGITTDPLARFSSVFSALIHDVDHTGVPNGQVLVENPALARMYNDRSVAEQNSLDLSWSLLMRPEYKELRETLCTTKDEWARFRALTVNSVMATDIGDKELKQLRNNRWDKAFDTSESAVQECPRVVINRKATIVIEHLIQASDISVSIDNTR